MAERETWATRVGFVLAAVGSAVGLGNLWQFPFKTAQFGGASFLLVYLAAAVGIGLPALLAEFVVGRRARRNTVDAFGALGGRRWRVVGALGLLVGLWILSYYSVVGGWVLRYLLASPTGAYFGDAGGYFSAVAAGPDALAAHAVFMACVVGVVALGVENGIERATKVMVPSVVVVLAGLAAFATTLDGAGAGYAYFLSPDLAALRANLWDIVPFAVGQAFFSLSLGMGAMVTYASYVDGDDSLVVDAGSIVVLNTLVGVLAGLAVFPLLFAQGVDPNTSGAGAVFVSTAGAFADLPAGRVVGTAFFGVVLVAALSSAISLLEVVVSYAVDNTGLSRVTAAAGVGGALFLLGTPSALSTAWLGWFDTLAYEFLLPLSVLSILLFVGWVFGREALAELLRGSTLDHGAGRAWLWTVRLVVLSAVLGTFALGVRTLFVDGAVAPPL
jgi:NSS family neurotransmitter:Na+ symporter